jgi:hypothetical protein
VFLANRLPQFLTATTRLQFDPGGVKDTSRWSETTGQPVSEIADPEGVAKVFDPGCGSASPLGSKSFVGARIRWYRFAQPPANFLDHSGVSPRSRYFVSGTIL